MTVSYNENQMERNSNFRKHKPETDWMVRKKGKPRNGTSYMFRKLLGHK